MSLKIQLGQTYPDKKGGRCGPMERNGTDKYPWSGKTRGGLNDGAYSSYNDKGEYIHGGSPDDLDLAAHDAEVKADKLQFAADIISRLWDVRNVIGIPKAIQLDMQDFLRIEKQPDPQDDAAQRADHDNKISREQ